MKITFQVLKSGITLLFLALILMSQTASAGFSPQPEQLSDYGHKELKKFVNWMRWKKYPENIVSRYVEDYMNETFYPLMYEQLNQDKSLTKLDQNMIIDWIDIIPTDANSKANYTKINAVEYYFRDTFGVDVELNYDSVGINYVDTFGDYEIKQYPFSNFETGVPDYLDFHTFSYNAMLNWHNSEFTPDYYDYEFVVEQAPKGIEHNFVRYAITHIDDLPVMVIGAALTPTLTVGPVLGLDPVIYENQKLHDSFAGVASLFASSFDIDSQNTIPAYSKHYGTFGLKTSQCLSYDEGYEYKFPKMNPLEAYLMEPKGGYLYPENIFGEAYTDWLYSLADCEIPYGVTKTQVAVTINENHSDLKIQDGKIVLETEIVNESNVPLSFVPYSIEFKCGTTIKRKHGTINWMEKDEVKSIAMDSPLLCRGLEATVLTYENRLFHPDETDLVKLKL